MKRPGLLIVCCWSSIFTAAGCFRVDGYSCTNGYRKVITCVLNITDNLAGPSNTIYSLKFSDIGRKMRHGNTTCPLVWTNNIYRCDCQVQKIEFMTLSNFSIHLCKESACHYLVKSFMPAMNMRLTPPSDVEVQEGAESFNFTWKSGYEEHLYLSNNLDYELLLQKSQSSWSQTLKLSATFESIRRSALDARGAYCIKARSRPSQIRLKYNGTWSEWSPMTCWQMKTQEEQDSLSLILTKSLTPVCVAVGLLLIVFFSPASRMKIRSLSHTPSPAHFFQPLFQQHDSNLQEWLSPHGKFALIYKSEEPPMTCDVTVVPKPIAKDPEENQDVLNLSVTPLTFSQSQSSYVGLPERHEAPPPVTVSVCPGNTSYTQLPCSVWDFGIEEAQVTPCPPETLSDISCADSGCSCEDLTQDPECSLPNSPVDDGSPPCFCNDYCILNKTAEGVVPVLVSK